MKITYLYLLFLLGYIFSAGIFNISGLIILLVCFFLLLFSKLKQDSFNTLSQSLILSLALSLIVERILYPSFPQANYIIKIFLIIVFILSLSYVAPRGIFNRKYTFPILVIIGLVLRIFIIFVSPKPLIDVFFLLKEAPAYLLNGINPYSAIYTQVYSQIIPNYYTYFPFSFLVLVPINYFFNDPRFLYVFIYLLIVYIVRNVVKDTKKAELLILMILFQPLSLLVFEQGYLDILLLGLLTLSFYFLKNKRSSLSYLFLGIALATKQTAYLTLPFFWPLLSLGKKNLKNLLWLILPPVVTLTPFILWNFKDFWYDTVYYLFNMDLIRTDKIIFALNIITLILKSTAYRLTSIPFYSLLMLSLIYLLVKKFKYSTTTPLPYTLAVFFLGFHLFATQAYINYFFFIGNLLILSQVFPERIK